MLIVYQVLEDGPPNTTRKVNIRFKPRNPASCNGTAETCGASQSNLPVVDSQDATSQLPGNPNYNHYTYKISLPESQGQSSIVIDKEHGGFSKTENNGGGGFPVTDLIVVQIDFERHMKSCHTDIKTGENGSVNKTIRIQAAVSSPNSHPSVFCLDELSVWKLTQKEKQQNHEEAKLA